ncbi:hypothetical protein CDCA_CDCA04G1278 [Cyanidium caldarium]|uniref:RING-CH-type domain-containing protein n=1 Tax=Cyanidium caldarium TaxID=2771 RepID=A0AAV9IT42_CYACA|nr:hypothetical protein CDCA_CDCA04G1278 [Cyanidium caldarium]
MWECPTPVADSAVSCRLCLCGDADDSAPLVAACACRGTLACVHPACLGMWLKKQGYAELLTESAAATAATAAAAALPRNSPTSPHCPTGQCLNAPPETYGLSGDSCGTSLKYCIRLKSHFAPLARRYRAWRDAWQRLAAHLLVLLFSVRFLLSPCCPAFVIRYWLSRRLRCEICDQPYSIECMDQVVRSWLPAVADRQERGGRSGDSASERLLLPLTSRRMETGGRPGIDSADLGNDASRRRLPLTRSDDAFHTWCPHRPYLLVAVANASIALKQHSIQRLLRRLWWRSPQPSGPHSPSSRRDSPPQHRSQPLDTAELPADTGVEAADAVRVRMSSLRALIYRHNHTGADAEADDADDIDPDDVGAADLVTRYGYRFAAVQLVLRLLLLLSVAALLTLAVMLLDLATEWIVCPSLLFRVPVLCRLQGNAYTRWTAGLEWRHLAIGMYVALAVNLLAHSVWPLLRMTIGVAASSWACVTQDAAMTSAD